LAAVITTILLGLGLGGIYTLLGDGIVLVHRGAGVLNFASTAMGMFGSFVAYSLYSNHGWPFGLALLAGIAVCAVMGATFHLIVMRRLREAAMTTRIVATLGLLSTLIGVTSLVYTPTGASIGVPSLLPTGTVSFGGGVTIGEDRLFMVAIAAVVTVGLILVQHRTRFGLATSAVAEDPVIAGSMGCSPDAIAAANWALGSAVGMLGVFLVAPIAGLGVLDLALLVISGMVAALVGRFESFPLAAFGGVGLGIAQSLAARYINNQAWVTAIPLLVIIGVLLARGRYIPGKADRSELLARVTPGRVGWGGLVFFVMLGILVEVISINWITSLTISIVMSLVVLSVIVVSGFAGQLSLAQLSLAGIGAFFTTVFAVKIGLSMWEAVLLGAIATALTGAVTAIPALRTRGSSLAIASLATANVITALVLNNSSFASLAQPLPSLSFLGMSFNPLFHARAFAMLALVVLAICLLAVTNLRRGAAGRRLLAMRANERAAMALGISVYGAKIFAFALAGLLAGLAGGLLESQLTVADYTSAYPLTDSINTVLSAVLGGIGWPAGALVGGAMAQGGVSAQILSHIVAPGNWLYVITGLSAIIVVVQSPDGLVPFYIGVVQRATGGRRRQKAADRRPGLDHAPSEAPSETGGHRAPVRVEANDITVRFGGQVALDGVSVTINPGEVVGLIGPNGAGKSTLIEVISGFQPANSGTVLVDGVSVDKLTPVRRARAGMSRSFQSLELFEDMSIADNLRVASDKCPASRYLADLVWPQRLSLGEGAGGAAAEFRLLEVADRLPSEVDYARRRLTAIARAVACDPGIVLLDEPAAGLDEVERVELGHLIKVLATSHNVGVLLIEHDVGWIFGLCDSVVALDAGRVIACGAPDAVRRDPAVVSAYLGPQEEDVIVAPVMPEGRVTG
jgi:ABC-type branched-subunit amino acid transport system ATPase component/branched-subunit amino acid ABC-type transport system permease component